MGSPKKPARPVSKDELRAATLSFLRLAAIWERGEHKGRTTARAGDESLLRTIVDLLAENELNAVLVPQGRNMVRRLDVRLEPLREEVQAILERVAIGSLPERAAAEQIAALVRPFRPSTLPSSITKMVHQWSPDEGQQSMRDWVRSMRGPSEASGQLLSRLEIRGSKAKEFLNKAAPPTPDRLALLESRGRGGMAGTLAPLLYVLRCMGAPPENIDRAVAAVYRAPRPPP